MLFNGFAGPLRLKRKASRLLGLYLVSLHGLALSVLLVPLAIPTGVRILLIISWLFSVFYHLSYYRRQRDDDVTTWVWQSGGDWVHGLDSQVYSLVVRRSLQTPWFVMLTLNAPGQKNEHLLILRDQIDPDSFRRLRVRIKFAQDETAARREESV